MSSCVLCGNTNGFRLFRFVLRGRSEFVDFHFYRRTVINFTNVNRPADFTCVQNTWCFTTELFPRFAYNLLFVVTNGE